MTTGDRERDEKHDQRASGAAEGPEKAPEAKARYPFRVEEIYKGHTVPIYDYMVDDLFSRYHPYMKKDRRLSHAIVLWFDMSERPLYLIKWWAPAELLTPDELARATYYESDLDHRVIDRGVEGGAIRSWETFRLWEVEEEEDSRLLELGPKDLAIYAGREFYDQEGVCLCYERQWITAHHPFGHARDFRAAKGLGITTEW